MKGQLFMFGTNPQPNENRVRSVVLDAPETTEKIKPANSQRNEKSPCYIPLMNSQMVMRTPKAGLTIPREKVLVLDLDNTLICNSARTEESQIQGVACQVKIEGSWFLFDIIKRPGLENFIAEMNKYYRLFIFTTGLKEYAVEVLKVVGISHYFEKIFHRDDCFKRGDAGHLKSVKTLGEPLENLVFIDDSLKQVNFNLENALPILPFYGDSRDNQLEKLIPFLKALAPRRDVRPVFPRYQRFYELSTIGGDATRRAQKEIRTKQPRIKTLSPMKVRVHPRYPKAESVTMYKEDPSDEECNLSNNVRRLELMRKLEPKLLESPAPKGQRLTSFGELCVQRAKEALYQEIRTFSGENDPENAVFDEDEENDPRDVTPRLFGNFSVKSPMHARGKQH